MRIDKLRTHLSVEHISDIERRYPLVSGDSSGWPRNLYEERHNLMIDSQRYPLFQEPLIECIPRYQSGTEVNGVIVGEIPKDGCSQEELEKSTAAIISHFKVNPDLEKKLLNA